MNDKTKEKLKLISRPIREHDEYDVMLRQMFDELVREGTWKVVGLDANGEPIYRMTEKAQLEDATSQEGHE